MASIFTKIANGDIPSYKIAEDDKHYAFLDINPITKGHTLVIPRQETDYIFDLDDDRLAALMVFAKKVASRLKRNVECNRIAVLVLGLEVPHVHIHLIPIMSESDLDLKKKLKLTESELKQTQMQILKN